ncbi:MAG: DUF2085 domain-containing protein [Anaerolineaceae bacterium]|nr:DUF2085 domain-containing protein [Anaerolineaceae bacterium]
MSEKAPMFSREKFTPRPGWLRFDWIILSTSIILLLGMWLFITPSGLLGKMDAIGYAVCHRIHSHSYSIGERALPLCARCTGMYLGALTALLYQRSRGRRMAFPGRGWVVLLVLLFAAFALDGVHSFTSAAGLFQLYEPMNWLRLLTGAGMGWGMAAILVPSFHQTIWREAIDAPVLNNFRQLLALLGLTALPVLAVLTENPLLVYPFAVLSALTVVLFLTIIYTLLAVMVTFRENQFSRWKELIPFGMVGFLLAMLQIVMFDLLRLGLTGTWNGFVL